MCIIHILYEYIMLYVNIVDEDNMFRLSIFDRKLVSYLFLSYEIS